MGLWEYVRANRDANRVRERHNRGKNKKGKRSSTTFWLTQCDADTTHMTSKSAVTTMENNFQRQPSQQSARRSQQSTPSRQAYTNSKQEVVERLRV